MAGATWPRCRIGCDECLRWKRSTAATAPDFSRAQAREREIAALRLPLTRFEVETIELDSLDAAREALLCVREDGMSMEEVATEGRYPYRHPEVLLEEIPEICSRNFSASIRAKFSNRSRAATAFSFAGSSARKNRTRTIRSCDKGSDNRILDRHFSGSDHALHPMADPLAPDADESDRREPPPPLVAFSVSDRGTFRKVARAARRRRATSSAIFSLGRANRPTLFTFSSRAARGS